MQRPVVVLPQPDSPTSPSVSPRRIVKLTPSTARTTPSEPAEEPGRHRVVLDEVAHLQQRLGPGIPPRRVGEGRGGPAGGAHRAASATIVVSGRRSISPSRRSHARPRRPGAAPAAP